MNYFSLINGLVREARSLTQYKRLGLPFAILAAIGMVPYIFLFLIYTALFYVELFCFQGLSACVDYLECWLKENRKGLRHATEAVLYFVCMPGIFLFRVVLSLFSIFYYFTWFFVMLLAYLATLGGVRWQPFLTKASYEEKITLTPTTNRTLAAVFSVIACVLLLADLLFFLLYLLDGGSYAALIVYGTAKGTFAFLFHLFDVIYALFVLLSVLIIFRKKKTGGENDVNTDEVLTKDADEATIALPEL